ncbi:MAG: hypothetical protein HC906_00445 [Bacteroidales bacterium]|nr:hypothetical protein [Bacteroidales bacterium]
MRQKMSLISKLKIVIVILALCGKYLDIMADSPCATFVIKITFYTQSGQKDSGFIYFQNQKVSKMVFNSIDEYFTLHHKIPMNKIDFSSIAEFDTSLKKNILAVNKSILSQSEQW